MEVNKKYYAAYGDRLYCVYIKPACEGCNSPYHQWHTEKLVIEWQSLTNP